MKRGFVAELVVKVINDNPEGLKLGEIHSKIGRNKCSNVAISNALRMLLYQNKISTAVSPGQGKSYLPFNGEKNRDAQPPPKEHVHVKQWQKEKRLEGMLDMKDFVTGKYRPFAAESFYQE